MTKEKLLEAVKHIKQAQALVPGLSVDKKYLEKVVKENFKVTSNEAAVKDPKKPDETLVTKNAGVQKQLLAAVASL